MTHGYEFFEYDYVDLDFDWDEFIEGYGDYEISEEWAEIEDIYDDIWKDIKW